MDTAPTTSVVEISCPRCRTVVSASSAAPTVTCHACKTSYESVFLRPPQGQVVTRAAAAARPRAPERQYGACANHPGAAATAKCRQCWKSVCDVCTFRLPLGKYCPDCASSPAPGSGGIAKAALSVVLAVAGAAVFFTFLIWAGSHPHVSHAEAEAAGSALGIGMLVTLLPGMALGFVARDEARRAGSPLAVIGIVLNLLLLGVFILLVVLGSMKGG